jgi:hypothetical protein
MPTRLLLGIKELIAQDDLEGPSSRGDQNYLVERVLELVKYLFRQTDGSRRVASLSAVFDRELHPISTPNKPP